MIVKSFLLAACFSALTLVQAQAASALGIDTTEWTNPSAEAVAQIEAMETAMAAMAKGETPGVTLQQAIDKIRELAEQGNDKDALFSMGFLMQQSQQQNALAEAMAYYKRAADLGQLQAMNNYGFILAGSSQEIAKTKEGVDFIKKAADGGLNAARRNMAAIYLNGLGGEERSPAAARELLEKAAGEGDGQAMFELAQFFLEAGGEEQVDDDKAWDWLNKASEAGNPNALATLGSVLFDGKTFGARKIDADPKAAVEKFQKLADQNVPAGLRTMAELHASGQGGVAKDFAKSLELYAKAAQGNDPTAQVVLAGFYDKGVDMDAADNKIDVTPNAAAALELYRLAARNNVPLALYNVGVFYEEGRAVDQDAQKAFVHYLQAAGGGFAPAMQKAGVYYLNGAGTPRDPIAAAGWFNRAASAGLPEGLLSLGVMAESGMVPVAAETTPFKAAAEAYQQIVQAPQVNESTRFEALIRLGGLHFRGALVAAGEEPAPDFEAAYKHFKQALNMAPQNEIAQSTVKEAAAKLTPEQITALDAAAAEAASIRAAATAAAAEGVEAAPAMRAEPTAPDSAAPAEPAAGEKGSKGKGAAEAPKGEKEKGGFKLPLFGR